MDSSTALVPVISVCMFSMVLYQSVVFFVRDRNTKCLSIICSTATTQKCKERDKAVVACIAAASLLFICAQVLEWITKGFVSHHDVYMHVWHGYDLFTAVIWVLFVYHLRVRLGWRSPQ